MQELEFYFEYSSPYAYFASERIEALCAELDLRLAWRPIMLGAILKLTGQKPLFLDGVRGDYAKQDAQRWAAHHDIPFNLPSRFPVNSLKAARGTLFYLDRPCLPAFVHACFRAYWVEGRDLMDDAVMAGIVSGIGQDADAFASGIQAPAIKEALAAATADAHERGVFGVPSYIVADELFWGNDRMDFMAAWIRAQRAHPGANARFGG